MIRTALITLGTVVALGSTSAGAAERVPRFDTAPSCRSAAAASLMAGRTTENCLADERRAHDLLEKSWTEFSAGDKSHCDSLVHTGGPASYVELLSCLEMSRDARVTAKANATDKPAPAPAQTTGAGTEMKQLPQGPQHPAPRQR